ncbi:MAG TPA: hemolysin family protein [Chryseolinea sp.]|nr:hemolysin family protein [Chryseolinea sp.]
MNPLLVTGTVVSLIFVFFFSVMESTYHAANKLHLELEGRLANSNTGKILLFFAKHPSWFIGTTLVGSTVSLVIFTGLLSLSVAPVIHTILPASLSNGFLLIALQSFLAAIVILVVAGLLPKTLSAISPNTILARTAYPFYTCFLLLFIITYPVIFLSRIFIVRVLRLKYDARKPFFGSTDFKQYKLTHQVEGQSEEVVLDKKIFHNALEFKTVKIRDCMIPRTEITSVELNDPIEKLHASFVESGHSKVIIYKQNIDEIIGYCHSSSLFKKPEEIREVLTPIIIVAETTSANELMIRFLRERKSLAVVIDEFGGTAGIVSMEDIIEEIFGEIDDEHNEDDQAIEQQLDERTFVVSARLEIDYLNEKYGWNLPTGEYETLGGLLLSYTQDFPKQGQVVAMPNFTFIIQATANNRIEMVRITTDSPYNVL